MEFVLPERLKGDSTDAFVRNSAFERLPDILVDTVEQNKGLMTPEASQKILKLAQEIREGQHVIQEIDGKEDGGPDWRRYGYVGMNCMDVGWFYLENYAYRLVNSYVDFYRNKQDPFAPHKRKSVENAMASLHEETNVDSSYEHFHNMLNHALWGNQADLSFSSGKEVDGSKKPSGNRPLLDDSRALYDQIFANGDNGIDIIYILDNCGAELLNDLLFMDYLITNFNCTKITIHAKKHPVFVSDALECDVLSHIQALESNPKLASTGKRLSERVNSGKIEITSHEFYTTPVPYYDAPTELMLQYRKVSLVIVKGDANYRRFLDDRQWPSRLSFQSALHYFGSANVLALRTCKSPVLVGLGDPKIELPKDDPNWRVDGKTGIMSFHSK